MKLFLWWLHCKFTKWITVLVTSVCFCAAGRGLPTCTAVARHFYFLSCSFVIALVFSFVIVIPFVFQRVGCFCLLAFHTFNFLTFAFSLSKWFRYIGYLPVLKFSLFYHCESFGQIIPVRIYRRSSSEARFRVRFIR